MPSIQPTLKHVERFTVTGFTVKTQNSDEFNEQKAKLPILWHQFYAHNLITDAAIFGVYSDYESNENGFYNVTVGGICDSTQLELVDINIHPGSYLVFQAKGEMPLTVIETWKRVWDYFAEESPYQRSFMTDFEMYTGSDEVAIYIGVNENFTKNLKRSSQ